MKKVRWRLLSILLVCAMAVSMLPVSALAADPEPAPQPKEIYVSAEPGDGTSEKGSKENPYASLAEAADAVNADTEQMYYTIYVMSNLTAEACARFEDHHVKITSDGDNTYKIVRGETFAPISDTSRSWYHPALIEVTTPLEKGSSVTLENIVLDDMGRHVGQTFAQQKQPPSGEGNGNLDYVQEAMIAAYGTGAAKAEIVLGSGSVLKNYGGLSAVRVTSGASAHMKAGALICDDENAPDRTTPEAKDGTGRYGAVWVLSTDFTMDDGAKISDMKGRAVFLDKADATINGTIENITSAAGMRNGGNGVAIYVYGVWNNRHATAVLGSTGRITNITGTAKDNDGAVSLQYGKFTAMENSVISYVKNTYAVYANDSKHDQDNGVYLGGIIEECTSGSIFRPRLSDFTLEDTGVIKKCTASTGVLYSTDGGYYYIKGTITENTAGRTVFLACHQGTPAKMTLENTAKFTNNSGVAIYVTNRSSVIMNGGEISGNGTGVEVGGKSDQPNVAFIMNGGKIVNNSKAGIYYTADGNAKVELNAGEIHDNGTDSPIAYIGGVADDGGEYLYIQKGVLTGDKGTSIDIKTKSLLDYTLTLDEDYPSLWLGRASTVAQDKIEDLVQEQDGQSAWTAKADPLWIKTQDADTVHFTMTRPSEIEQGVGLYAGYIPLNADGTPADDAELTLLPLINDETLDITLTGLTAGQSYAVSLVTTDKYYVTIKPANITVYTGGTGYGGTVVDGAGHITTDSKNGFPEPGFEIILPEPIKDETITDLTLKYEQDNGTTLEWTLLRK